MAEHPKTIQTTEDIEATLARLRLGNNWLLRIDGLVITRLPLRSGTRAAWTIHVEFIRPDSTTGVEEKGAARMWIIRAGDSADSVIKTAWLAIKQTVEHELMEAFLVDDRRLFDPHKSVADLTKHTDKVPVRGQ